MPLIDNDVAPLTDHDKVLDCPELIELGEAVNELITGTGAAVTVTVAEAVVEPELFVAVKV
jgi:hypothetical protein